MADYRMFGVLDWRNWSLKDMYAIVTIEGKQYRVTESQKLFVPYLGSEIGATVEFSNVNLYADDAGVLIGTPVVKDTKVTATVLEHMKDEKVIVFKKKRRKGFKRMRGHRQQYTQVVINSIEKA
jgi:large subunit ribosomal protein L21